MRDVVDVDVVLAAHNEQLERFSEDVGSLWCPSSSSRRHNNNVVVLEHPPTPLEFSRDFVNASRPCIIRNAILEEEPKSNDDRPCPLLVTLDDIVQRLDTNKKVDDDESSTVVLTVDVTPDGHGDCVRTSVSSDTSHRKELFVQPNQVKMTVQDFRERLRRQERLHENKQNQQGEEEVDANGRSLVRLCNNNNNSHNEESSKPPLKIPDDSVVYYSRQNDCLRTDDELQDLQHMFPSGIEWASEVFQSPLEAVNLWMGNQASVSSMHKDHYENLFYVASGEKIFTVCPPADVPFLYEHVQYPQGTFQVSQNGNWHVQPMPSENKEERVRWIAPDVSYLLEEEGGASSAYKEDLLEGYPLLKHAHPMEIRVQAGELLYLPALWFHQVTQSCETVGVNWWYDMRFDSPLWCYFSFLQQLQHHGSNRIDNNDDEDDMEILV
jgi:hypothetical protein